MGFLSELTLVVTTNNKHLHFISYDNSKIKLKCTLHYFFFVCMFVLVEGYKKPLRKKKNCNKICMLKYLGLHRGKNPNISQKGSIAHSAHTFCNLQSKHILMSQESKPYTKNILKSQSRKMVNQPVAQFRLRENKC